VSKLFSMLLAAAFVACGPTTAPSTTPHASAEPTATSGPAPEPTASATAAASVSPSSTAAAEPAPAGHAGGAPLMPDVAIDGAEPVTLGSMKVTSVPCKLGGSPMTHKWFGKAARDIAMDKSGAVFLLDHEGKVRRYLDRGKGGECVLELDAGFGKSGVMAFADAQTGDGFEHLALAPNGTLWVSDPLHRLRAGEEPAPDDCPGFGTLRIDPTSGLAVRHETVLEMKGDACQEKPVTLSTPKDQTVSDLFPVGDKIAASFGGAPFKVSIFKSDGKKLVTLGADKDGDDQLCQVELVIACGGAYCVFDSNCRRLRVWKADGKFVGAVEYTKLFGLFYPWLTGVTMERGGVRYASLSHKNKDDSAELGLVFRIDGLR
jgi:hypothetical protein